MFKHPHLISMILLLLHISCRRNEVGVGFYYWKSVYEVSEGEKALLGGTGANTIYMRYFDVVFKDGKALPESPIRIDSGEMGGKELVPVVYITNEVVKTSREDEIQALAKQIVGMVNQISSHIGKVPKELQIDCDWTEKSKGNYFLLLSAIKKEIGNTNLSATIRLHQVKYKSRTGVPPVDKGILMHYNMGSLGDVRARNSIYNHEDAEKYIEYANEYPLALDVALPIFEWAIHFRGGKIMAINSMHSREDYVGNAFFKAVEPNLYQADSSAIFRGDYFQKGDLVKIEDVTPTLLIDAAKKLSANLRGHDRKVVFFDLDSTITTKFSNEDFLKTIDCFR